MRCHIVTATLPDGTKLERYAGSSTEVTAVKQEWQAEHGLKRGQATSEQVEVPVDKAGLLAYLNKLL